MGKKLLSVFLLFSLFLLSSWSGFGQCSDTAPTVTISTSTGSTLCNDGTITFSSNVSPNNPSVNYAYQWQVKLGAGNYTNISGQTSSSLNNYSPAIGTNRFRLNVTYCSGAPEVATVNSPESGIITVYEKKEGKITINASNTNICPGENVSFMTSNPGNLGASPSYKWELTRNGSISTISTAASFSNNMLQAGDQIRLLVNSTVPCVDPVESNIITFTEKAGTPDTPAAFTSVETEVCPGLSKTYTVPNDNMASEYIWTLPSGWSGSSTTNSITVTTGNSGSGDITVIAKNSCGTSAARSLAVSVKAGTPATPGIISGTAQACPGIAQTFSVPNVSGVNYTWDKPTGWTGTSTSNSITLTPTAGTAVNGNLSVTAGNDCGTSQAKILAISVKPGTPVQPGSFTGPANLCPGTQETYSVPPVTGATSYIWTLPTGFSASNLTTSNPTLVVTAGSNGSGSITVSASNDCDTGPAQSKAIDINPPKPVLTDDITGSTGVCASTPGLKYSIPTITNASSYEWSIPSGWTITSGSGTKEITVTAGTAGGTISVKAINGCGDSASKSITVGLNPPPPVIPGAITFSDGTDKACVNIPETYSIPAVSNATGYLWTLPNGTTQSTTTPSLSYTATTSGSLNMSVSAVNSCGTSTAKSFSINVASGLPAQPGTITASKYTVCPPETGFKLSVPQATDADSYQWFLPTGWEVTNGAGTRTITVKINASSNYSNPTVIGVEAKNNCGNSTRRNTSSNINDANAIAVSDFVFVNLGEDKTVCSSTSPISITANYDFGGKNLKLETIRSSSGQNLSVPNSNSNSYTFNYTPSSTDLSNGQVTIILTTQSPGGACQAGKDEMTIFFRPDPTASIVTPAAICSGGSTTLNITATPNTVVTYRIGTGGDQTLNIGAGGTAVINTGILTGNTTYNLRSVQYQNTPSCSKTISGSTTVTVTPKPTANISYATPFCSSTETAQSVTLNTTGTVTGAQFSASSGLTINPTTGAITPGTPGTYTVTYTIPASGGCEAVIATTQVKISEKVAITSQPAGDRVCEGENVQFSVSATGEGLTYIWFKGTVGSGTAVTGGTTSVLTLNNVTISNAGSYYVEVSGTSPCAKVPSQVVELVIDEDIEINTQPANTAICVGGTATLNVAASAGSKALNYQWYKGAPGSGTALGTNSASLVISGATLNDSANYYVVISGPEDFICDPVTSQTAVLSVRDTPIVEISGTTEICDAGDTEIFFTTGTPNAIVTYTINNGSSQTITLNASGEAVLSTGSLNVTNNEITTFTYGLVSVMYPDAPDCTNNVSGSAVVTVNPTPEANVSFENDQITFCNDTTQGSFTPNLQGSGAFTNGIFSAEGLTVDPNDGSFSPANTAAGNYVLKYFLTGAGGCSDLGATLDIIIYENVKITSEPFPVAACTANSTQLEVAATGDDLRYQWFKVGATDAEVGNNSPILELNNITAVNAGDYYVVISGDNACGSATSEFVTVTVDENIVIAAEDQPQSQNICSGNEATLRVSATASGDNTTIQYQWQFRATSQDAWSDSGASQTGDTFSEISTGQAGEYRVRIDGPDGFSCDTGFSQIVKVTTYEAPTANAGENFEICSTENSIAIGEGATASNQTSLIWTTTGAGTISNATNLTEATYAPVAADLGVTLIFTLSGILEVEGVQICEDAADTKEITIISQPELTAFTYTSTLADTATEFCETDTAVKSPTIEGNNLGNGTGVFTVDKTELTLDSQTGEFTPNDTDPGVYIITYTFNATSTTAVCTEVSRDFTVTIGANPVATFEYDNTIYCRDTRDNTFNTAPIISFTEDGHENADSFVADDAGLVLDEATGSIDLSASTAGIYKITRTVDYTGTDEDGCQPVTAEFNLTINDRPIPDFTYSVTEYCSDPAATVSIDPVWETNAVQGIFSYTSTPTGANLVMDSDGKINITTSDEGTYTIKNTLDTEEDGCDAVSAEFTITIDKLPVASFSYAGISAEKSFCISNLGATIDTTPDTGGTYSISGPSALVTVNSSNGQLTWTAADGVAGSYVVTYKVPAGTVCEEVSYSETISIDALPVGGVVNFTGVGRVFTTCENAVDGYAAPLVLTGETGQVVEWQYKTATSSIWSIYNSQDAQLSSDEVEDLVNNTSTVIRAKISNGTCNTNTFSATAIVSVIPSDIKPSPVEAEPTIVCFGTDISLSSKTGYGEGFGYFEGGDFTNAGIKNNGWNFTDPNGNEIPFDASANSGTPIHWHKTQPKWKFETAAINSPYTLTDRWWNPLSDGKTNEHFAITQGAFSSNMDTPPFTLTGMDEAKVTFDQAYNLTTGATIRVVLLKNGVEYKELDKITGPASSGNYEGFGSGTPNVNDMSYDLGSYLGEANLKVRFEYTGVRRGDVWAVDNIKVPEGPQGVLLQWFYDDDPSDTNNSLEQIGVDNEEKVSFTPRKIGWNDFEVKTALLLDSNGNACESLDNIERIRVFVFDTYETSVAVIPAGCGSYSATLDASISAALQGEELDETEVTFDGYRGEWKIIPEGDNYTLINQDVSSGLEPKYDPHVIFESGSNSDFTITWELKPTAVYPDDYSIVELQGLPVENPACPPVSIPVTPVFTDCTTLDFDGEDDVIVVANPYSDVVSIEAWIRPEVAGGTIISGPNFRISTPTEITPNSRWYHIAVSGGRLYIDGIDKRALSLGTGGTKTLIGADWIDGATTNHFSGWIEEVRLWKEELTVEQIRFMMNQRLQAGANIGEQIPMPAPGNLQFSALVGYYRLISAVPDPLNLVEFDVNLMPVNGVTPNLVNAAIPGRLLNMTTNQENTAPLPYFSGNNGPWGTDGTWARPAVWDPPHTAPIEWNIVKTSHNITSGERDIKVLGLISEKETLDMEGANPTDWENGTSGSGNELFISHYLLLNGIIDLNGESQLVQPVRSIVAESSTGYLERDQQGTLSSFNYNYWTSPVSVQGAANNSGFTMRSVMWDGTDSNSPISINYQPGYPAADGQKTNPITKSDYWIFKFDNRTADDYDSWQHIGSTGVLKAGEGHTMKGVSGLGGVNAIAQSQNYVYRGKPNNGDITLTLDKKRNYLVGNPYTSSIDSKEFIKDNLKDTPGGRNIINVFDGAIYFWDHFSGATHVLREYIGGYAVLNITGGVRSIATDDRINSTGTYGKTPKQFIPVSQGFFINSGEVVNINNEVIFTPDGGQITFKNSQRIFESEGAENSIFLRPENISKTGKEETKNVTPKIRIAFKSPKGYNRQLLVGADPNTTNGFDLGYDAPMIEYNLEDMYWLQEGNFLVIQGVPDFGKEQVLPIGIRIDQEGEFKIKIDELENMSDDHTIYLKDIVLDTIHDLRAGPYTSTSEPGEITDRFQLIFYKEQATPDPIVVEEPIIDDFSEISLLHSYSANEMMVLNPKELEISVIHLFDLNGKLIEIFDEVPSETEIRLKVSNYSEGIYILKMHTDEEIITRKIIIKK
ncbi:T9SS type A sorting domain-containing protein [Gillisia hiemivivida]|uniref:T9SS type A sorting domain-containing protein n=1 Tax=Gillisia hiemivivida TaxID=291190 RepID=A0A5C6ZQ37_9FLAO|nr:T9SS type A sorting domain-containing protein [Gillisia hiemivivida]TXD92598.1 T9SS type A sorting domain-containing protein [Gillisia hiemivivida]